MSIDILIQQSSTLIIDVEEFVNQLDEESINELKNISQIENDDSYGLRSVINIFGYNATELLNYMTNYKRTKLIDEMLEQ